jgi:branched-chain amino acid transport system permease protein
MEYFLLNLLNALQLSMLYFLLAVGLTLIFGLMDTLNFAHGGFYTIGAYVGWRIATWTDSFWVALAFAPLLVGGLGYLFQRYVLHPLSIRGRETHLDFALLTFGLLFVIMGLMEVIFGSGFLSIKQPELLNGSVPLLGINYPIYRMFIIGVGLTIALLLWLIIDRTVWGAIVRAGVDNRDMVLGMGINITLVFAIVFAVGTALAALAGVVAAPVLSIFSRMGTSILVVTFIIVVVGGLGNFRGSIYASLLVGFVDTMGQAYKPTIAGIKIDLEFFGIYLLLAVVMIFRPSGLFGTKGQSV